MSKRYSNDARQIRDAAERYALENGNFPPNGIGGLHSALRGYVPDSLFAATTNPLGGVWDWDYPQDGFTASISVYLFTASDAQLRDIDRTIDVRRSHDWAVAQDGQQGDHDHPALSSVKKHFGAAV